MSTVADFLDRFNRETSWGSMKPGLPAPDEDGPWLSLTEVYQGSAARRFSERFATIEHYSSQPLAIVGNYAFRDLSYVPLMLMGAVFVTQRRVLILRDNLMVQNSEYCQHWRLLETRAIVLAGDSMSGETGVRVVQNEEELTEELFAELRRTYQPLIDAFREHKFVAQANGWGSLLDSLVEGFCEAGKDGPGLDEAWALWEASIAGRNFPTRRRPRRHRYVIDGLPEQDVAVRAGCCLWYMTDEARASADLKHCYSCYLTKDAERIAYASEHPEEMIEHEEESSS